MLRTRPIAILLLALLLSTPALAAKWIAVGGKEEKRGAVEVDASSLHAAGAGAWRIWHRESHAKPVIADSGAFSFSRLTTLSEFYCDKRLGATIQRSYTAADGSEVKNENLDRPEVRAIAPDSGLEAVFSYTCKNLPKPPAAKVVESPPPVPVAVIAAPAENKTGKAKKAGSEAAPPPPPSWGYSGNTAPDKWGSLGADYANCSLGRRQSPIDIRGTVRADLPPIKFAYRATPLSISDDGNGIRVDTEDAGSMTVDGIVYELQHLQFHRPGEGRINGKAYDMSVDLVHKSKAGQVAVVAVMLETGKEQGLIRTLWTHLPLEQNKAVNRPELKIDPTQILPVKLNYYTYLGSLTRPPCAEGVLRLVLKTPMQISKEQVAGFATIYKNNARPLQAVNSRVIKESR
jgi:carbonic anhydrase